MRLLHIRPGLAILAIGLVLAGSALGAAHARAASHTIVISDFAFSPATLTVTVGDTVTWTNADPVVHTATAESGAFDTGDLAQGESGSITFTEAGTFPYICSPHPTMTGTIVVEAVASAPPSAPAAPEGELPNVAMPIPGTLTSPSPMQLAGIAILVLAFIVPMIPTGRRREH